MPDYTTICRRVNKVAIEIKKTLISYKDKEVVVYLDSSGAKVTTRGEWMRQKWKVRRGWIKVHIAVKRKFGEFVRATKVKNMFNEIKLKYILYNAILKYDVTHTSFFASLV